MGFRSLQSTTRFFLLAMAAAVLASGSGCFNPNGGVTGYFAYISTPLAPKTIVIYDVRTGEPFFVQEVPVGKQLNFRFLPDGGDDPLYSPARLQWGIGKAGDNAGQLDNQLTCPPEEACRIEVEVREPELPAPPQGERFRIEGGSPGPHTTPEGGKLPPSNDRIYE